MYVWRKRCNVKIVLYINAQRVSYVHVDPLLT
jgi:hypothetical protein